MRLRKPSRSCVTHQGNEVLKELIRAQEVILQLHINNKVEWRFLTETRNNNLQPQISLKWQRIYFYFLNSINEANSKYDSIKLEYFMASSEGFPGFPQKVLHNMDYRKPTIYSLHSCIIQQSISRPIRNRQMHKRKTANIRCNTLIDYAHFHSFLHFLGSGGATYG